MSAEIYLLKDDDIFTICYIYIYILVREEADQLIAKMEKEEAELIEKLRWTQDRQRAAYEALEQALQTNPEQ